MINKITDYELKNIDTIVKYKDTPPIMVRDSKKRKKAGQQVKMVKTSSFNLKD